MTKNIRLKYLSICTIVRHEHCEICQRKGVIMERYLYSDMVMESSCLNGISFSEKDRKNYSSEKREGVEICRLNIRTDEDKKRFGVAIGSYTTIYTAPISSYADDELNVLSQIVADELWRMINASITIGENGLNILVAGLGNRDVTPDSLGARVTDSLNVTRHIKLIDEKAFSQSYQNSISAISCGVLGKTGIETLELMRGIVSRVSPDVIIAVDSLAAKEYSRLGAVVQLSDKGIVPGGGIGNKRHALNAETLGVPVIALGIPTVVSASTLICGSLQICGHTKPIKQIENSLDELKSFFVTPKDCDALLSSSACLISRSIEYALL